MHLRGAALRCIKTVNFMPKARLATHLTIAWPPQSPLERLAARPCGRLASPPCDAAGPRHIPNKIFHFEISQRKNSRGSHTNVESAIGATNALR
jgi:hypothetical protein